MKKTLVAVIIMIMAVGCVGCSEKYADSPIVGEWIPTSITSVDGGPSCDYDELPFYQEKEYSASLVLNADGTCEFTIGGEIRSDKFTIEKDNTVSLYYNGEKEDAFFIYDPDKETLTYCPCDDSPIYDFKKK